MIGSMSSPVRVAIVNDYEIVVAGIAAVLEPFSDRVSVVELDSGMPVVGDVDVVPIRAAQVSRVIWLIMGAGAALLLGAIVGRLVRRVRAARASSHDQPDQPDADRPDATQEQA